MRGWPETFPQPHIKAASCSPTKGSRPIQGLEVGGGAGARHCLPGHPEQGPRPQGQPLPTAHCGPRSPRSWALGNGLLQPPAGHPPCPHGPGAGSAPGPITHPGLRGEGCLGDTSHSCCYADPLPPPPRHTPRLASPPQARSSAPPARPALGSPRSLPCSPPPAHPAHRRQLGSMGEAGPQLPGLRPRTALGWWWQRALKVSCRKMPGAGGAGLELTAQSTSLMMPL